MASERKFYRTVFQVEVLSEYPITTDMSLEDVFYEITKGDCSGVATMPVCESVDGPTMAMLLQAQGSPEFFNIDEEGNELDEDGDDLDEL